MRTEQPATSPQVNERFLRLNEVQRITGKARTQIYAGVKSRTFPAPIKDGRCSLWVESEVQGWVVAKIANAPRKR